MKQRLLFVMISAIVFTIVLLAGIGGVVQACGLARPQSSVTCLSSIVVTSTLDSGAGTLRQALADVCAGGIVTFNDDTTIYLNSQLDLTQTLTIDGNGHAVTVSGDSGGDGSANVRVFNITAGKVVTLSHLSVVKGNADKGGGVYNAGTLTLQECTLANNVATTSSAGGGAIWNENGTLTLLRTTVVSNTADSNGGGILHRYGTLILQNSTVSGNHVSTGSGGGIDSINGTLILRNSTLSGNSSSSTMGGGGLYHWGGTLALYNTLIANSTGGDCTVIASPTIAANVNNLIEDGSCSNSGVGFVTGDPNLGPLNDNGGSTFTQALLPGSLAIEAGDNASCLATDQRGVSRPQMSRCDIGAYEAAPQPVLRLTKSVAPTGTVAYHGGVVTYTLVLSNVSTMSDPTVMLTDTLPSGMLFKQWVINSGATVSNNQITWNGTLNSQALLTLTFQATHSAGLAIVNTAIVSDAIQLLQASATNASPCQNALVVSNGNDSGPGSLRQAIADTCAGATITFANDISTYLDSQLIIDKRLTIDGRGHAVTISGDSGHDGSANVRAFNISAGSVVTLSHLTITNCYDSDRGAGVYNSGTLTVISSTLSNNAAAGFGGAIDNNEGVLSVYSSTLSNNSAAYGGAVNSFRGTVVVQNSLLSGNSAPNGGGAISGYQDPEDTATLTVLSSTFSTNSSWHGGGIGIRNTALGVRNSTFVSNTAQYDGGGISFDGTEVPYMRDFTVDSSTFVGNQGGTVYEAYVQGGGGIFNNYGTMTIRNSTFSGNSSPQNEGGAIVTWGALALLNSTLVGNSSRNSDYTSGLANWGSLDMKNTIIAGSFPGPDCRKMGTVSISSLNSLVEDGTCSENGVNFLTGDPQVGPLADNGGVLIGPQADTPLLTHALLPGSPAIDTGDAPSCLSSDQRGIARPQFGGCDRGAVEMRGFTLTLTGGNNQSTPVNLAFPAPLSVTLREIGGHVLGGATITFTAPASGASLAAPTTTRSTNAEGIAALLPTANGTTGSYTVTASAAGAGSVNFVLTNLKAATLTSVTSAPNPSTVGDVITFTATVTAVNGAPAGLVTFYDNALSLGSSTLEANGVATLTTTSLSFGLHPAITATYAGSANHFASTSGNYTQTVKANTTTSLTSAPNASVIGHVVTFTATVTSTLGTPTGTVTFYDNGLSLGSGALTAGGVVAFTTTNLAAGTHPTITATYNGSAYHNSSTSSNYSHTVNKFTTTTSVTSSLNPSQYGQAVTFTATVTSPSGTPAGTVQFYADGSPYGLPITLSDGQATTTTALLSLGTHPVTVTYSGAANFNASDGSLLSGQTVTDAPIAGLSAVNSSPTRITQMTTFIATITSGSNVTYTWDFGDQHLAVGTQVTHRYTRTGIYTATVTATNSIGSISATTLVTIEPVELYLPLVVK